MGQPEIHDVLNLPSQLRGMLLIMRGVPASDAGEHWLDISRLIVEEANNDFVAADFTESVQ